MRFYPQLSEENILAMQPQKSKMFIQAMNRIKAKERLVSMDALQYPHMKQKDKNEKHREVCKQAYPENFVERVLKTTELELI
jgi:hypothetical protein